MRLCGGELIGGLEMRGFICIVFIVMIGGECFVIFSNVWHISMYYCVMYVFIFFVLLYGSILFVLLLFCIIILYLILFLYYINIYIIISIWTVKIRGYTL